MATPFDVQPGLLYDYAADKADTALMALARQADLLRDPGSVAETVREGVLDHLHTAIVMTTRILTIAAKLDLTDQDARYIFAHGLRGYQRLAETHKIPSRVLGSDLRTPDEKFADFVRELDPLLDGPRSNRTEIHQLLLREGSKDRRISRIADLTEKLTMGEMDWPRYVADVRSAY